MLGADQTLLRLADPTARADLLSAANLLAIATTAYDIDPGTVVGDTTAVFDTVDLAVAVNPGVGASARWGRSTDSVQAEGTVVVSGLTQPTPGADAVWVGKVAVRTGGGDGVITAADVLDDGRLPTGEDKLTVGLEFSAPAAVALASPPKILPVVVAFLVAEADASPRLLLQQSEAARRAASRYPIAVPAADAPPRRHERCVCWLLPATAFDDDGWPGGGAGSAAQKRSARLAAARSWLAEQGIAVATT